MIQHVSLGLDLELYSVAEHGMIYWYLDYLHGSRLQNLSYTWSFVEKMKQMMPPNSRGHRSSSSDSTPVPPPAPTPSHSFESKSSNKKSKHKKKKQAAPAPAEVAPPVVEADPTKVRFMREIKFSEMQRNAMRAYFQVPHPFAIRSALSISNTDNSISKSSVVLGFRTRRPGSSCGPQVRLCEVPLRASLCRLPVDQLPSPVKLRGLQQEQRFLSVPGGADLPVGGRMLQGTAYARRAAAAR